MLLPVPRSVVTPRLVVRQGESEHAAAALARFEEQPPLVVLDDRAADRKADAQAVVLGGEERREQLVLLGRTEPGAAVADADLDFAVQVHPALHAQLALGRGNARSEEHTSELQSLMRISYAVFCLKTKTKNKRAK